VTRTRAFDSEGPLLLHPQDAGSLFADARAERAASAPCLSEEQVGTLTLKLREVFGGACYAAGSVDACRAGAWSVALVSKTTGEVQFMPFRCRSWRCVKCAPQVNARDASRIEEALGKRALADLLFVTLTLDKSALRAAVRAKLPPDATDERVDRAARTWAWRTVGERWKALRDRLAHRYREGFYVANELPRARRRKDWVRRTRKARIDYVQTWEQHQDGWPHVHAVLWCPEMARDVRARGFYQHADAMTGEPRDVWRWNRDVLVGLATSSGFGRISDVQFPRKNEAALAGYLVKIASELTGSHRKDQTPVQAPRGFKRLRTTPKWLRPIRESSGEFLGSVVGAPAELVALALAAGAESLEQAAKWATQYLDKGPLSEFANLLRSGRAPPLIEQSACVAWETG
jgi:hypothetical protein